MNPPRIIVVEDDHEIRELLSQFLQQEGFTVETVASGVALDQLLARVRPDLLVLDLMLPGEDGFSICRRLRQKSDLPIVMLTAKRDDIDRIVGLELGADDYLGKPFHPRELVARIRAVLRRTGSARGERSPPRRRFAFPGFVVDLDARRLETETGQPVTLTSAEFDLLTCFVEHPRRVLSRDQLLDWTRGRAAEPFDRTIDVTVSRLRRRLEALGDDAAALISTVRNAGYLFTAEVRDAG